VNGLQASVGSFVRPDGWRWGEKLSPSDGYRDTSFPGCDFRIPSSGGNLAVNVVVTGRKADRDGLYRCKIEFVGDGRESTFSGGKIKL